jgi:hypothetical protein
MMVKPKHAIIRIGRSCIFVFFFREERDRITTFGFYNLVFISRLTCKLVAFKSILTVLLLPCTPATLHHPTAASPAVLLRRLAIADGDNEEGDNEDRDGVVSSLRMCLCIAPPCHLRLVRASHRRR